MCKEVLEEIYKFKTYSSKAKNKTIFPERLGGDNAAVYGELTYDGTNTYIEYFKKYINRDTVFYDLGSGLGKMVLHMGLQCDIKKSIGIELSKERYKISKELKENHAPNKNNIEFYCESFLSYDIDDATLIYCDTRMYDDTLTQQLYDRIPKGCLFTFTRASQALKKKSESKDGLDRTYFQDGISYIIKE